MFHQGMLWMGYVPGVCREVVETKFGTSLFTRWSQLPGQYLNAFRANDIELEIPFLHPRNHLYTKNMDPTTVEGSVGTLIIGVFSALQVGDGGSADVSCSLFVELPEAQFRLPYGADSCIAPTFDRRFTRIIPTDLTKEPPGSMRRIPKFEQRGGSTSRQTVNNEYNITYSGVTDSNIGIELEGDELDSSPTNTTDVDMKAQQGSSMDKITVTRNPLPVVTRGLGFFNNRAGMEFIDRLTLDHREQAITKKSHFSREVDEMNLGYLNSVCSFVNRNTWTDRQSVV